MKNCKEVEKSVIAGPTWNITKCKYYILHTNYDIKPGPLVLDSEILNINKYINKKTKTKKKTFFKEKLSMCGKLRNMKNLLELKRKQKWMIAAFCPWRRKSPSKHQRIIVKWKTFMNVNPGDLQQVANQHERTDTNKN